MANNYNSILQSNNTDLQAILDLVNALPEAGMDSGSSSEGIQVATGSFTVASTTTTTNTTVVEITGLGFRPDEVYIYPYYAGGLTIDVGSCYFIGCYTTDAANGSATTNTLDTIREKFSTAVARINTNEDGKYSRILSTDDGFSLATSYNSITVASYLRWNYIALKREV